MKHSIDSLRSSLFYHVAQRKGPIRGFPNAPASSKTYVRITGGIGDLIVGLGVAESLNDVVGDVEVYSKWPNIGEFFSSLPQIKDEKLFDNGGWDWYMIINSPVMFAFSNSFKDFKNPAMLEIYLKQREFISKGDWARIVEHHPLLDHPAAEMAVKMGLNRETLAYEFLGLKPKKRKFPNKTLEVLSRPNFLGRYITVHDGFDANNTHVKSRATKTWGINQWKKLCEIIKNTYPDIKIVQLGGPTSRIIKGVDVSFVAKIPFEKSMEILNNSICHIDGDSGLVHAARLFNIPSVVMFGPTNAEFFGYKENSNVKAKFCGNCWWLNEYWMSNCPVGYEEPECMNSIDAYTVFCEVNKILKEKLNVGI